MVNRGIAGKLGSIAYSRAHLYGCKANIFGLAHLERSNWNLDMAGDLLKSKRARIDHDSMKVNVPTSLRFRNASRARLNLTAVKRYCTNIPNLMLPFRPPSRFPLVLPCCQLCAILALLVAQPPPIHP